MQCTNPCYRQHGERCDITRDKRHLVGRTVFLPELLDQLLARSLQIGKQRFLHDYILAGNQNLGRSVGENIQGSNASGLER